MRCKKKWFKMDLILNVLLYLIIFEIKFEYNIKNKWNLNDYLNMFFIIILFYILIYDKIVLRVWKLRGICWKRMLFRK